MATLYIISQYYAVIVFIYFIYLMWQSYTRFAFLYRCSCVCYFSSTTKLETIAALTCFFLRSDVGVTPRCFGLAVSGCREQLELCTYSSSFFFIITFTLDKHTMHLYMHPHKQIFVPHNSAALTSSYFNRHRNKQNHLFDVANEKFKSSSSQSALIPSY